jgi:hypothetical protein
VKILLIVQREPGTNDCSWIVEAADEYTLDEWNGRLPDALQKAIDDDPINTRPLWVEIPDDSLERVWDVPTVQGVVPK